MRHPDGSAGRKILSYKIGREAGQAWANEPGRRRSLQVQSLWGFFSGIPSTLEWARQTPWPGWTHWSIVAVVVSGLDLDDHIDQEDPESRRGVEEATRDLSRDIGDISEGRGLDAWFTAGFIQGACRA